MQFKTHTGETVTGEKLTNALNLAAKQWQDNAIALYQGDDYPPHVTLRTKRIRLLDGLKTARKIRANEIDNFTLWQRVDTILTGECIGFLPKTNHKKS